MFSSVSIVNGKNSGVNYRWYVLTLATLTHAFVLAMPWISLPVLFKEISEDLELSLVQIGAVWGAISLGSVFVVLIGGSLGDRFGVKRTLSTLCFLTGLSGALIGLSNSFSSLAVTVFLFGLLGAIVPINVHRVASIWFTGRQLGLANGIVAVGVGLGFTVGSMISATILSPLLGGWRNVLFLYGAISIGISILWILTRNEPSQVESSANSARPVTLRQSISHVAHIRVIWSLGFIMLCQLACTQGMIGYLPLYLRDMGWTAASADGTLAAANVASTVVVVPVAFLSDKLGSRKIVLLAAMLATTIGVGLLSVVGGAMVWVSAIIALASRDGFMAVTITMITETKGVGAVYTGTALGLAMTLSRLGGAISPPLGNSLASINPSLPFILWAAFGLLALFGCYFVREAGQGRR
jgi:ACS family glucarate transporter-like MFS transporter